MLYDLSIIVVNYNVQHFLRQTLDSINRASSDINTEVFVVDNNSIDGSVNMVIQDFPQVKLIANKDNPGFSKANNQAILQSKGKYILLLNPDTVLQEDTLKKCFSFMESHPEAGAVGAKMLDGSGQFLPESKRGFPSPWVSFCKATGLSSIFKKSKTFNQYHLGYLDENETNEIDVLCGAFMFMRKSVIDEVGMLDEAFFMYGEDIDLSYRIKEAGYKIYYFPETQLIHFKGESTKKSSVNYVRVFYQAMIIFAKKHFSGKGAGLLVFMLNIAIFGRAMISLIKRFTSAILPQIIDFTILFGGIIILKEWWEIYHFNKADYFKTSVYYNLIAYALLFVFSMVFHGVYRKNFTLGQLIRSILLAVFILLALYGMINSENRFSRALVIFSGLWAMTSMLGKRLIYRYLKYGDFQIGAELHKRIFIIGSKSEINNVIELLEKSMSAHQIVGKIAPEGQFDPQFHSNTWSKIEQLTKLERANEFIFCVQDLEWGNVISLMNKLGPSIEYKMVGDDKMNILGSKSKNSSGELYSIHFQFNISRIHEKWKKKALDIIASIILILLLPILIWVQEKKSVYIKNLFQVLFAKKTLISYDFQDKKVDELPTLQTGILTANPYKITDAELIHRANLLYAKDYTIWKDLELLLKNLNKIGSHD